MCHVYQFGASALSVSRRAPRSREERIALVNDAELRASELRFRGVFEGTPVGINLTDVRGHVLATNPAFARMLGCTEAELQQRTFDAITHPDDRARDRQLFAELLSGELDTYQIEKRYLRADDRTVWVRLSVSLIRDDLGVPQFTVGVAEDITEQKQAEERLRDSERRFASAFAHSPIGMALVGLDGRWLQVNRALCDLVGYTEADLLASSFQEITHPDDLELDLAHVQDLMHGRATSYQMEKRYFHRDGRAVWVQLSVSLVSDLDGSPWYLIAQVQDITDRKRAHEALESLLRQQSATMDVIEHRATHDALTGLPNRTLLIDRVSHGIVTARRQGSTFALLVLDLDGFKQVNDEFGHAVGDRCLREVGQRFASIVRESDTVARLGGDEFAMMLWGANEQVARVIAAKAELALSLPMDMEVGEITVGVSVGSAMFPEDGADVASLLHHADMAMYRDKRTSGESGIAAHPNAFRPPMRV